MALLSTLFIILNLSSLLTAFPPKKWVRKGWYEIKSWCLNIALPMPTFYVMTNKVMFSFSTLSIQKRREEIILRRFLNYLPCNVLLPTSSMLILWWHVWNSHEPSFDDCKRLQVVWLSTLLQEGCIILC